MPTVQKVPSSDDKAGAVAAIEKFKASIQEMLASQNLEAGEEIKRDISNTLSSIQMHLVSHLLGETIPALEISGIVHSLE